MITRQLRHCILRCVVAANRGERFGWIDYTDELMRKDLSADAAAGVLRTVFEYEIDTDAQASFCEAWQISAPEFFRYMIFRRPSFVVNLFVSAELRRVFGTHLLAQLPEFSSFGLFRLHERPGFYVPVLDQDGLIAQFAYYNTKGVRIDVKS